VFFLFGFKIAHFALRRKAFSDKGGFLAQKIDIF